MTKVAMKHESMKNEKRKSGVKEMATWLVMAYVKPAAKAESRKLSKMAENPAAIENRRQAANAAWKASMLAVSISNVSPSETENRKRHNW